MNNRNSLLFILILGMGSTFAAHAGAFFGAETDNGDQSLLFAGAQTEGNLFAGVFAGTLRYTFLESNQNVDVQSNTLTPTVGYRFALPVSISVALGATWEEKQERAGTSTRSRTTSAFVQVGAFYWKPEKTAEFLLSYTEKSEFFWGRLRAKHRIAERLAAGGEVFKMGNDDLDSRGIGALMERQWSGFSSTLKAGVNDSSSNDRGVYGGLEFYVPF